MLNARWVDCTNCSTRLPQFEAANASTAIVVKQLHERQLDPPHYREAPSESSAVSFVRQLHFGAIRSSPARKKSELTICGWSVISSRLQQSMRNRADRSR